jgi:hypothetical protein
VWNTNTKKHISSLEKSQHFCVHLIQHFEGNVTLIIIKYCFSFFSDEEKIEIATINPGYVLGPVVNGTAGTSTEVSNCVRYYLCVIANHQRFTAD